MDSSVGNGIDDSVRDDFLEGHDSLTYNDVEESDHHHERKADMDSDEEDDKVSLAVQRHLDFADDDKEHEQDNCNDATDVENPPARERDEEMSRKFGSSPQPIKRTYSTASFEDIGSSEARMKKEQYLEKNTMGKLNWLVWAPTKLWLGEVWRDLTYTNACKCGNETKAAILVMFEAKDTWSMCLQYLLVGLVMSFVCEVVHQGPQYNTALLLALLTGFEFHFFPSNSVRPQLVLSVLVGISFIMDIILFAQPPHQVGTTAKVLTAVVFLSKGLALYNLLCLSSTGSRAKKYLWRRLRVFFVPLSHPRKPMREIRSRVLAIEWLQGGVAIGYMVLFIFGFMTLGVGNVMSSPSAGMPLVAFLPLKFLTSSGILMVLAIDTDITLCFAYFGCLGGMMPYVKAYIHSKHQEYGGWPLSYALNPYRVYAVAVVKFIDVCFGFAGWAAVGTTFSEYYSLGYNVMALVAGTVTILVLSDIWSPLLLFFVVRMINRHEALVSRLQESEEDSDDSELDEFDIRNNERAIKSGREMRYRNLNRGFMKPMKSEHSVGSSSSDEGLSNSSSEDDGDYQRGSQRTKMKKRTRKRPNSTDHDVRSKELNINLSMALGGGNSEDDESNSSTEDTDEEEEEVKVVEEEDRGEIGLLTSPGDLARYQYQHQSHSSSHHMPAHLMPAAHGWGSGKHSQQTTFSPDKGRNISEDADHSSLTPPRHASSSAESDLNTTSEQTSSYLLPAKKSPSYKLPPKLPPLETFSPAGKSRPNSVPKLQLTSLSSPAVDNNGDTESDVEYAFDSPYQPKIRTKTGTPIQKHVLKPLPPVSRPPPFREKRIESHITIEEAASIAPDKFTEMWEEMETSASFSAQLHPENDIVDQKLVQLVSHLQGEKFYVVAAGEADSTLTIYGFASGFKKTEESDNGSNMDDSMRLGITAVSFLMELKIHTDSSLHPQGLWSFECTCKCSSPPASAVFIKMMLLGDCLCLVKS